MGTFVRLFIGLPVVWFFIEHGDPGKFLMSFASFGMLALWAYFTRCSWCGRLTNSGGKHRKYATWHCSAKCKHEHTSSLVE